MPLTRIRQTAIGNDSITTAKLDDTSGGLTLPGVEYVKVPVGNTAQRPSSPLAGEMRYNTDFNLLEQYNAGTGQWQAIDSPPTVTSLAYTSPLTAADPSGGETITLTGTNFQSGGTVTVGGTAAASTTVVSSTSVTFVTPAKTAGDYDVVFENSNGLRATLTNGISYNGVPAFTSPAAGKIADIVGGRPMTNVTIVAAEPDGGTLAYSVTSNALPTGLSLNSGTGVISGTPTAPTNSETVNFTITATDDENQTNTRNYNFFVLRPVYNYSIDQAQIIQRHEYPHMTRTASAGNTKKWTLSMWVRRHEQGNSFPWLMIGDSTESAGSVDGVRINNSNQLNWIIAGSNSVTSVERLEDPDSWYHLVFAADYDLSGANSQRMYVNGKEVTYSVTSQVTQGFTGGAINANGYYQRLFSTSSYNTEYTSGSVAEIHFVDGQQLTPSSFAQEYNGAWIPKEVTGMTYGTNGFYLDFDEKGGFVHNTRTEFSITSGTSYGNRIDRSQINADSGIYNSLPLEGDFDIEWKFGTTSMSAGDAYKVGVIKESAFVDRTLINFANGQLGVGGTNNKVDIQYSGSGAQRFDGGAYGTAQSITPASDRMRIVRTGSTFYWYINDSLEHTFSTVTGTDTMYFFYGSGEKTYAGYVDDIRVNVNNGVTLTNKSLSDLNSGVDAANSNNWIAHNIRSRKNVTFDTPTISDRFARLTPRQAFGPQIVQDCGLSNYADTGAWRSVAANVSVRTGKWYYEVRQGRHITNGAILGFDLNPERYYAGAGNTPFVGQSSTGWGYYSLNGSSYTNNAATGGYGDSWTTTGDIIGVALDTGSTGGTASITFYKNGVSQGVAYTSTNESFVGNVINRNGWTPIIGCHDDGQWLTVNFGDNPTFLGAETAGGNADANGKGNFKYAPPSGYLALCESNITKEALREDNGDLDIDNVTGDQNEDHFKVLAYTGDGVGTASGGQAITGVGFQPDFVMTKKRATSQDWEYHDSLRGAASRWLTPTNTAPTTSNTFNSFDSDGFTVAVGSSGQVGTNENNSNYISYSWKAGGAPTASNTQTSGAMTANSVSVDGVLQSAYTPSGSPSIYPKKMSVNKTAGFSIIQYRTTDQTQNITIPHGLDHAPDHIWIKNMAGAGNTITYLSTRGKDKYNGINSSSIAYTTYANYWGASEPDENVFGAAGW